MVDTKEWTEKSAILFNNSRGSASRKKILQALKCIPKNCNQIANDTTLNWRTVNRHLELLITSGFVKSVNIGEIPFYALTLQGEKFCINQDNVVLRRKGFN